MVLDDLYRPRRTVTTPLATLLFPTAMKNRAFLSAMYWFGVHFSPLSLSVQYLGHQWQISPPKYLTC